MSLIHFQLLSAALFSMGIYGVLARRSAVLILLALELMLNAVNINLIAFAAYGEQAQVTGQIIAIFVITVAAAEVGGAEDFDNLMPHPTKVPGAGTPQ